LQVYTKGASLMQPANKSSLTELLTPAFAALSAADATPDTAYFHKFFEVKAQREAAGVRPKSKRRAKKEAEVGPLASDEDSLAGSDAESDEIGENSLQTFEAVAHSWQDPAALQHTFL
jgi:hypothetical protein